ncbi:MAG TPA: amidohydrolase family protein [Amycolatopsis sp.]|uniref:amidohydrolase family protein n=1 Tax=Amycolatopsis sp. TaxID=37632 RepID=UPI002B49BD2F|nr:amidohydrolase family protein [Amycolatopsis sp.]HKS47489.1 amidohydrolase family protein [Amycolatopsis sp.]
MTMPGEAQLTTGGAVGYRRIATEEAWAPPEMFDLYRRMLERGEGGAGFRTLMGHFVMSDSARAQFVRNRLQDLGEQRLADMDAAGLDHAVLSLTSPGTQSLDPDAAREIAKNSNDLLAEACRRHPGRFSGLAAVGFEDVPGAVKELDRGITELKLKGVICNSHIRGRYLDEQQFYPILEAIEALNVPLYLHPNMPNDSMIGTLAEAGLDGGIYGFAVETGMHLLRIITAGVLDRFPNLRIVVGHLGEGLPFWFYRFDYMHAVHVATNRHKAIKPLELKISEYFRRNIWLTTSGMPWAPTITYVREVVGPDRLMYAMDYPYQYLPEEVRMQDALPLSTGEKKQFFQDNAIRVFDLDEAAITAG